MLRWTPCPRDSDDGGYMLVSTQDQPRLHLSTTNIGRRFTLLSSPSFQMLDPTSSPAWICQLCACVDEAAARIQASIHIRIGQHLFREGRGQLDQSYESPQGHVTIHTWHLGHLVVATADLSGITLHSSTRPGNFALRVFTWHAQHRAISEWIRAQTLLTTRSHCPAEPAPLDIPTVQAAYCPQLDPPPDARLYLLRCMVHRNTKQAPAGQPTDLIYIELCVCANDVPIMVPKLSLPRQIQQAAACAFRNSSDKMSLWHSGALLDPDLPWQGQGVMQAHCVHVQVDPPSPSDHSETLVHCRLRRVRSILHRYIGVNVYTRTCRESRHTGNMATPQHCPNLGTRDATAAGQLLARGRQRGHGFWQPGLLSSR